MPFLMGGEIFHIEDLDAPMDKAFLALYAAYLSNHPYNWADFEKAALEFFSGETGANASAQDKFFTNFTIIWRRLFNSRRLDDAESLWEMALRPALIWESQHPDNFIHKGTPFYFWGGTSILKGDLDRGYALMHQAVEEDVRTTRDQFPNTPAFALVTLNYAKVDQFFRGWVLLQAELLIELIKTYCTSHGRQLSLDEFRNRFLLIPPNRDTVSLFAYTLARLLRLQNLPGYALRSDFAGQLEMDLLFDIILVIDAAIKAKNPDDRARFRAHIAFLSDRAGLGIRQHLSQLNTEFNRPNNFDSTLTAILDGSFRFNEGSVLSGLAGDLAIAYGLRNHAAHNVSSVSTIWERFSEIRQSLFNTLFLSVEVLY